METLVKQPLTNRQAGIAHCVFCGMSNHEIAAHFGIAHNTTKTQIQNILHRINKQDRTQIAVWWWVNAIRKEEEQAS